MSRPLLLAVALALPACGGPSAAGLPGDAQRALCDALLPQVTTELACGRAELAGASAHYEAGRWDARTELHFRPSGSVERYEGLRLLGPQRQPAGEPPACVVNTLRALRLPPRETPLRVDLLVRYLEGPPASASAAVLTDGTCALTVPLAGR